MTRPCQRKTRIVTLKDICCVKITLLIMLRKKIPAMHTIEKERNIDLSFNEKLPESARTWELCDKSLVCLPCFIYGLVL